MIVKTNSFSYAQYWGYSNSWSWSWSSRYPCSSFWSNPNFSYRSVSWSGSWSWSKAWSDYWSMSSFWKKNI